MPTRYGQHPDPLHTIVHLSDTHLLDGRLQYGRVDTQERLRQALARLTRLDPVPQALVFTGDLADKAEPGAYRALREIVEPAAAELGAQVVWVIGNHDERAPYAAELFGAASQEPQDRVYDVAGLRVVALDTSVPGWHHGALEPAQLQWLAGVLATPAEHGTVLAMHHPPIPLPTMPVAELIELHGQAELAEVVRGTDVRAVLGGHYHYTSWSTFAGVPVSVAAATCYTLDPAPDRRLASGVDAAQAFTLMHLYGDEGPAPRAVVATEVPLTEGVEVTGYGIEGLELLDALSPEERFEQVARKDSAFNTGQL